MTDNEKIRLLKQMVNDFWASNSDECNGTRAAVYLETIYTVLEFGGADNAAD